MTKAERLFEDYKQLPEEERARFHELFLVDDEVEMTQASKDEIYRRADAFHSGTSKGVVVDDLDAFFEAEAASL